MSKNLSRDFGIEIRPSRGVDNLIKDSKHHFDAELGRWTDKGFVLFEHAPKENPYRVYVDLNIADALALMSLINRKEKELRDAVSGATDPLVKSIAHNDLGCFLFHWGKFEEAQESFARAAALDLHNHVATHNYRYCRDVKSHRHAQPASSPF